jgi:hypothetical protein
LLKSFVCSTDGWSVKRLSTCYEMHIKNYHYT